MTQLSPLRSPSLLLLALGGCGAPPPLNPAQITRLDLSLSSSDAGLSPALAWEVEHATRCTLDGASVDPLATSPVLLTPGEGRTRHTLLCLGATDEGVQRSVELFWGDVDGASVEAATGAELISGDLLFEQYLPADLSALDSLRLLGGGLGFVATGATAIEGLAALERVGGPLVVDQNRSLTEFTALERLTDVGGDLFLSDNTSLTRFAGLSSLQRVDGSVIVQFNDALRSVEGLSAIESVGANLYVEFCKTIALPAMAVQSIGGHASFSFNSTGGSAVGQRQLDSFSRLGSIGGTLQISGDPLLEGLAFESLERIEGDLALTALAALTSVDLPALTEVRGAEWDVVLNKTALCDQLDRVYSRLNVAPSQRSPCVHP